MTVVREDMDLPGGRAPLVEVRIELAGAGCEPLSPAYSQPNQTIIGALRLKPGHGIAPNGYWEVDLVPNESITPAGTAYRITRETSDGDIAWSCISVPVSGGPYDVSDILVDPPGSVASAALQIHLDTLHIPHVDVPAAWGEQWRVAREEASSRVVRLQVWGDSISVDAGTTFGLGYVSLVRDALQAAYGNGGSGYVPWSVAAQTGAWTVGHGFGGGSGTAVAAATLTYTGLQGTEIRIWHQDTLTGSYRYRIDGGAFTTITPPTGFLTQGCVVILGLPDVTHTLEIEWVSGTVAIYGMEARRSTGIILQRCAQGGRQMAEYSPIIIERLTVNTNGTTTVTSTAPGAFTSSHVNRYISSATIFNDTRITAVASATSATLSRAAAGGPTTNLATLSVNPGVWAAIPQETMTPGFALIDGLGVPDVIIIALGANDGGNPESSEVSWLDGAANILRPTTLGGTLTYSPEVIVIIEHYGSWIAAAQGDIPAIAAAHAQLAGGNGAALFDVWGMGRRSWAYWNNLGYFTDSIHPSAAGHRQYAQPLIDLLTR